MSGVVAGPFSIFRFFAQDVAKCLLVCGVRYQTSQQQPSPEPRSASPPLDTSSLAALEVAEVTALRFSRSRETDGEGEGGKSAASLKVRQTTKPKPPSAERLAEISEESKRQEGQSDLTDPPMEEKQKHAVRRYTGSVLRVWSVCRHVCENMEVV